MAVEQHLITLLLKIGVAASIASVGVRQRSGHAHASARRTYSRPASPSGPVVCGDLHARSSGSGLPMLRIPRSIWLDGRQSAGGNHGRLRLRLVRRNDDRHSFHVPSASSLSLPFLAVVGFGGGLLRDAASDKEDIWRISPFPDANVRRIFQYRRELRGALFHLFFTFAAGATEFLRQVLGSAFKGRLFTIARWNDPPLLLVGGIRLHLFLHHAAAEGLEQYAQRGQTRGTGAAAHSGAARGACQPDQSALSLQYAELGFHA